MNRFEELKINNTLRRLRDKLICVSSEFSNVKIKHVDRNYHELYSISDTHIVCNIDADGGRVENISDVFLLLKKEIEKFIDTHGDQFFWIVIPFGDYNYEINMSMGLILNMFDILVNNFYKCNEHCTEEILIYTDNFKSGICLLRDEYCYSISIWNS